MICMLLNNNDVSFDPNVIPLIDNFIEKCEIIKIIYQVPIAYIFWLFGVYTNIDRSENDVLIASVCPIFL